MPRTPLLRSTWSSRTRSQGLRYTSRLLRVLMLMLTSVSRSALWGTAQYVVNYREQFLNSDGLRHISIHAGGEASLPVPHHRVSSHGDNGQVPADALFVLPDRGGRFESIHL